MEMPDIDKIVDTVIFGVELVDEEVELNRAAIFANKKYPCGLVDDYVKEYIGKTLAGRADGQVTLDSAGERKGRVQKVIESVAEKMGFEKPKFIYRFAGKEETAKTESEPKTDYDRSIQLLIDIVNRVERIERKLDCAEVKIVAQPKNLTHWEDVHKECIIANKEGELA